MTPSEIYKAYEKGANALKIFPASNLDPSYIKNIKAPLPNIPLIVTGGINLENINEYLDAGVMATGIGGLLLNEDWLNKNEWDKFEALVKQYKLTVKDNE